MKTFEKTEEELLRRYLQINNYKNELRSGSVIIFNFANIGNVWASKDAKLIICIAFF